MYSLHLVDGTIITPLERLNPSTFRFKANDSNIYFKLTPMNLAIGLLYKDDILEDVFVDYCLQNFSFNNGIIQFRIDEWNKIHKRRARK